MPEESRPARVAERESGPVARGPAGALVAVGLAQPVAFEFLDYAKTSDDFRDPEFLDDFGAFRGPRRREANAELLGKLLELREGFGADGAYTCQPGAGSAWGFAVYRAEADDYWTFWTLVPVAE